jgi:XTP/dITP diphosphohydrolase
MMPKIQIIYSTTSAYKQAEIAEACKVVSLASPDGSTALIGELFNFDFRDGRPSEPLERDLEQMVRHKVVSAYRNLLVPCIAEHAGLIFGNHITENYPGGLTQPMWDALGAEKFISETSGAGRPAVARAVIGYCDGLEVRCFSGETQGKLADRPRGLREFYWDTVFIPAGQSRTYAEICSDAAGGLKAKIEISQSIKALAKFLQYRLKVGASPLFP